MRHIRYEVNWTFYDYDFNEQCQVTDSEQFKTFKEALSCFIEKKQDITNEHVRIVKILDEYSR